MASDPSPVNTRLANSIAGWSESGATTCPVEHVVGHWGQPRPEPVRRTAAPVTTSTTTATTVPHARR